MTVFSFYDYPDAINKKVVLLQHFKSYLEGNTKFQPIKFAFNKENAPKKPLMIAPLTYIKKWHVSSKAIVLCNSNNIIQVVFKDSSELILA